MLQKLINFLTIDQFCYPTTVNYTTFTITWNETQAGATIEAACTGSGLNGKLIFHKGKQLKFIM